MIARLLWLIGIMLLGNIAMAIYVLIELFKLDKDATVTDLVIKK